MTTVTNKILTEVYGKQPSIQMLYMPMDSLKEFENDNFAEVVGALIPMCIFVMINISERLKTHTSDSNEDKVQRLL